MSDQTFGIAHDIVDRARDFLALAYKESAACSEAAGILRQPTGLDTDPDQDRLLSILADYLDKRAGVAKPGNIFAYRGPFSISLQRR